MTVLSLWLQRKDHGVLSSRFSSEPRYTLGITVSTFLPSEEDMMELRREGSWVEGTAGAKAWRPEVRPSQERGGVGFERGRGERAEKLASRHRHKM